MVGRQRRRDGGARAAAGRGRAGALRRARRAELFREVEAARDERRRRDRPPRARPAPCEPAREPGAGASCGTGSSSWRRRSSRSSRSTAASSRAVRSTTTRSSGSSATSDDEAERREAWEASKTIGAVVADDVRELARLRNEAARSWASATGSRSRWRPPRWTRRGCSRRSTSATGSPAGPSRRGRRRRTRASPSGSAARPPSCGRGTTRIRSSRRCRAAGGVDLTTVFADADVVELARATFAAIGIDTAPILDRSDLFSRDGKCQHAFCIDVDREGDVRVLAQRRARPLLGRHDAARARARRLRHRLRRLAPVAPARLPPDDDRGHRDPHGPARPGGRVAARGRRRRRGRGRASSTARCRPRSRPSCSSSRAGCS